MANKKNVKISYVSDKKGGKEEVLKHLFEPKGNIAFLDAEFNAGSVYSTVQLDFYNEYGNIIYSSKLNISVKYLSSKTLITLSTKSQESASFLEQYFKDNGIRLKIVEIL